MLGCPAQARGRCVVFDRNNVPGPKRGQLQDRSVTRTVAHTGSRKAPEWMIGEGRMAATLAVSNIQLKGQGAETTTQETLRLAWRERGSCLALSSYQNVARIYIRTCMYGTAKGVRERRGISEGVIGQGRNENKELTEAVAVVAIFCYIQRQVPDVVGELVRGRERREAVSQPVSSVCLSACLLQKVTAMDLTEVCSSSPLRMASL